MTLRQRQRLSTPALREFLSQSSQHERKESSSPPPSLAEVAHETIFDSETVILRKYDRHFDTATSMMEELHHKKLEVAELQNFLQQHDIQQIIAKMDELRDAESKIDSLVASIRDEIPLAMGVIPEKGWENFKKLGYSRSAGAVSLPKSPVKRPPSVDLFAEAFQSLNKPKRTKGKVVVKKVAGNK